MRRHKQNSPEKITPQRIALCSFSIACLLGTVALLLVAASATISYLTVITGNGRYRKLLQLFSLSNEWNIPAFFSAFLLFFAFLLLLFITVAEHKRKRASFRYWGTLAFGFLLMTIDELCSLHEKLIPPMRALMGNGPYGFFFFSWVIVAIPVVFILILFFSKFWWQLPEKTRRTFLIAAVVYLGGCLGLELIGGYYLETYGIFNMTFCLLETMEESLEMGGVIIFIWGLLNYMEENCQEEIRSLAGFIKNKTQNLPFSGR